MDEETVLPERPISPSNANDVDPHTIISPTRSEFPLPTLAEEANADLPTLQVDSIDSPVRLDVLPVNSLFGSLSEPGSPTRRRRSSQMHRKRSSLASLSGLVIPPSPRFRRRSSVTSTGSRNEFGDFQDDDDEFGEFDDYVEQIEDEADTLVHFPVLDDDADVQNFTRQAINDHFGGYAESHSSTPLKTNFGEDDGDDEESPFMLTDRAVSLWRQLTAPPPLQPPDWKRSRIRRLFLVSLGIPVDLDEILPKMTHKKLVLPSTRKQRDKKNGDRPSRRKIPPPPEFEVRAAQQLCQTTRAALEAMDSRELQIHANTIKSHTAAASDLLTYWLEQRDSAKDDKETFEAVVENLVKYHKKQKDEQSERAKAKKPKSRFSMRG